MKNKTPDPYEAKWRWWRLKIVLQFVLVLLIIAFWWGFTGALNGLR